jgi:pimeloyl-ACP methyl ester carboxylesterase
MSWRPVMEELPRARFYAPDLRGYGTSDRPPSGYDVFTLTDDIRALIEALKIDKPVLVSHDWGGALGWIFAHRYGELIRKLVVVNCPHPATLVRAVLHFEDFQTIRIPWVPVFMIPRLPELFFASALGRTALRFSFTLREGKKGSMNVALVDELVARFQHPDDMRGPIEYYREMVRTQLSPGRRAPLEAIYRRPIAVPITLVWGAKDGALSARVAMNSALDAGRPPGAEDLSRLRYTEQVVQEAMRVRPPIYTIGREANSQYKETLNGVQTRNAVHHQFTKPVDPFRTPGDPKSGLLPGIHALIRLYERAQVRLLSEYWKCHPSDMVVSRRVAGTRLSPHSAQKIVPSNCLDWQLLQTCIVVRCRLSVACCRI